MPIASAIVIRIGSPDGAVLAALALHGDQSHPHCGYIPGSYWAPGTLNDDPAAMADAVEALAFSPQSRHEVFISLVDGYSAIDWFVFEQ